MGFVITNQILVKTLAIQIEILCLKQFKMGFHSFIFFHIREPIPATSYSILTPLPVAGLTLIDRHSFTSDTFRFAN